MEMEAFDRLVRAGAAGGSRRHLLGAIGGLALASLIAPQWSDAKNKRRKRHQRQQKRRRKNSTLKVMTRNIYLGADISPLFAATSLPELIAASTAIYETLKGTDFPSRAKVLAAEIVAFEPHLVSLQEVSLWRTQTPSDGSPTPNAQDVAYDFLASLLDELAKQGARYEAVATVDNFDGEVPVQGPGGIMDLRLTDRGAILARTDLRASVFAVSNAQAKNFTTNVSLTNPIIGGVTILRGWTAVDVKLRGFRARYVNTHLEAVAPPVQVAQGAELLAGPLNTDMATILTGDFNSDAYGVGTPGQTDTPTYQNMLAAGFSDSWPGNRGKAESITCCQAENLRNAESAFDQRIDFVLIRGAISAQDATRIGANQSDKTPSGLWPSDHAGITATLRLKQG